MALCVALVGFATLEQASAAHASDACNIAAAAGAADLTSGTVTTVAQDDGTSPDDQQQQRPHHCCGAHTSNAPPLQLASVPLQLAQTLMFVRADDAALDHAPQGLERPPRTTAIV